MSLNVSRASRKIKGLSSMKWFLWTLAPVLESLNFNTEPEASQWSGMWYSYPASWVGIHWVNKKYQAQNQFFDFPWATLYSSPQSPKKRFLTLPPPALHWFDQSGAFCPHFPNACVACGSLLLPLLTVPGKKKMKSQLSSTAGTRATFPGVL